MPTIDPNVGGAWSCIHPWSRTCCLGRSAVRATCQVCGGNSDQSGQTSLTLTPVKYVSLLALCALYDFLVPNRLSHTLPMKVLSCSKSHYMLLIQPSLQAFCLSPVLLPGSVSSMFSTQAHPLSPLDQQSSFRQPSQKIQGLTKYGSTAVFKAHSSALACWLNSGLLPKCLSKK